MDDIKTKRKLWSLFDYQEFSGNERINKMMADAEANFNKALSDEELAMVSAAGDGRDYSDGLGDEKYSVLRSGGCS